LPELVRIIMEGSNKKQKLDHENIKLMNALIKEKDQASYEFKQIPIPKPKKGELLLKMEAVAICGSGM